MRRSSIVGWIVFLSCTGSLFAASVQPGDWFSLNLTFGYDYIGETQQLVYSADLQETDGSFITGDVLYLVDPLGDLLSFDGSVTTLDGFVFWSLGTISDGYTDFPAFLSNDGALGLFNKAYPNLSSEDTLESIGSELTLRYLLPDAVDADMLSGAWFGFTFQFETSATFEVRNYEIYPFALFMSNDFSAQRTVFELFSSSIVDVVPTTWSINGASSIVFSGGLEMYLNSSHDLMIGVESTDLTEPIPATVKVPGQLVQKGAIPTFDTAHSINIVTRPAVLDVSSVPGTYGFTLLEFKSSDLGVGDNLGSGVFSAGESGFLILRESGTAILLPSVSTDASPELMPREYGTWELVSGNSGIQASFDDGSLYVNMVPSLTFGIGLMSSHSEFDESAELIMLTPLDENELSPAVNYFSGVTLGAAGIDGVSWLGEIGIYSWPFVQSEEHGALYCYGNGGDAMWMYDYQAGWWFTRPTTYPWMYSYNEESWLYYWGSNQTTDPAERWFYHFNDSAWISIPSLLLF